MKDLVTTDDKGRFETTTRKIANALKDGVNKKRDDGIHRNIIKVINNSILNKVESISLRSLGEANATKCYTCSITNATFIESEYTYGKNNKAEMYILNEEAYHLVITLVTKYKKAMDINLQFILAFKQLREHFQNTKTLSKLDEQEILENIIPHDKFGTKSKVNGEPREQIVKSYYRSANGKAIDENLVKRIEVTQLTLFGDSEVYTQKLKGKI